MQWAAVRILVGEWLISRRLHNCFMENRQLIRWFWFWTLFAKKSGHNFFFSMCNTSHYMVETDIRNYGNNIADISNQRHQSKTWFIFGDNKVVFLLMFTIQAWIYSCVTVENVMSSWSFINRVPINPVPEICRVSVDAGSILVRWASFI